ncbi:MAG: c-type cytochrome [Candidatus Acidiferrales bacterium]
MKMKYMVVAFLSSLVALVFLATGSACYAQIDHNIVTVTKTEQSHVSGLTGHAYGVTDDGVALYRRFCVGCHGAEGNGEGENAQWIDPRPRDFTVATFKCRSTPTGTLPTDDDLFDAITRGFVTTNMPSWRPLTPQQRANLVATVKSFSPRWESEKPGTPITIPAETPANIDSILRGRALFQKMECWKCHGTSGQGNGPSASTLTDDKGFPIKPYDFATGTRFMCGTTNQDIYRIFMTGLDGSPMPSFAGVIQPDQAWDLVHFLRALMTTLKPPEYATFAQWLQSHPNQLKPIGPEEAPGSGQ